MSEEIDSAGALITAAAAASVIDQPEAHRGPASHGSCANCGFITSGRFCSNCGQATHIHRSILHVIEELVHGVLHLDGRIWRTLPMLIARPGKLSRTYIDGQRARFVSPFALYLFCVFLMVFVFSFTGGPKLGTDLDVTSEDQVAIEGTSPAPGSVDAGEPEWATAIRTAATNGDIVVNTGNHANDKKILKKLKNPELAAYKIQQTAYKFAFLLIPISLPFVAILFLFRRGVTLFDHAVFVLYSLSFMSLLFVVIACLDGLHPVMDDWLGALLITIPPVHMFFQLKGAYTLSWFSALWRTGCLLASAVISLSLFVVLIVLMGLTG